MGAAGRRLVKERFDRRKLAEAYELLIEELLASENGGWGSGGQG